MERDWVVTAAEPCGRPYDLTHLNSAMRRIDLICKLLAPIFISILISAAGIKVGVLTVGAMSIGSWTLEVVCARRAWNENSKLKASKATEGPNQPIELEVMTNREVDLLAYFSKSLHGLREYGHDLRKYFTSAAWAPSLALSFLHISALTYSATLITHLLNVGFSLNLITVARAAGSVVEISSTVVTPVGVQYLSRVQHHGRFQQTDRESEDSSTAMLEGSPEAEARTETGLERLGLWGISWQLLHLVSVISWPASNTWY